MLLSRQALRAPLVPHTRVQPCLLRPAPRSHFSQAKPSPKSPKPAPSTPPPTVFMRRSDPKGSTAPGNKPAAPEQKLTPQEQLKEFEAVMMNYLQASTKPISDEKDGKSGKGGKEEDPEDAILDAATEALIKRKEEEFRRVNFWDAFVAPELRHNFLFILLLALIIGLCLKILRLKGEILDAERMFAAERLEMQEQATRAALPVGANDQDAQTDEVMARVQVITGLEDPKDLRLLRQQVLSAIRFTRASMTTEAIRLVEQK